MMFIKTLPFFILLIILLGWGRNRLFQRATTQEPLPQLVEFTPRTKALLYLGLMGVTLLLMFSLTQFSLALPASIITITVVLVISFVLLLTLQAVLRKMRKNKQLSISLLIDPYVLLIIALITAVELSFLSWVKEVTIYFQFSFFIFVIFYSVLLIIIAITLSLINHETLLLRKQWDFISLTLNLSKHETDLLKRKWIKRKWNFISLAVLDSLLVVLLSAIFLQIILVIIYLFN